MKKVLFCFSLVFVLVFSSCVSSKNISEKEILSEYYAIAEEYYSLKNYDKATQYYKRYLLFSDSEIEKEALSVKYKLAKTYILQNKFEDAQKIYSQLLEVDSDNSNLQSSVAFCYLKLGNFDKAEEIYTSLIEKNKSDLTNYKNLILLKIVKGEYENAEKLIAEYKTQFPLDDSVSAFEEELKKRIEESQNAASSDTPSDLPVDGAIEENAE